MLGAADEIAQLIDARSWFLCDATDGFFITSDHPVLLWTPPQDRNRPNGDGAFRNPRAQITFPLSSTKLLLIAVSVRDEGATFPFSMDSVAAANEARTVLAERYIYSPKPAEEIARFAAKHRTSRFGFEIGYPGERAEVRVVRDIKKS